MDVGIAEKDYYIDTNANIGHGSEKIGYGVNCKIKYKFLISFIFFKKNMLLLF